VGLGGLCSASWHGEAEGGLAGKGGAGARAVRPGIRASACVRAAPLLAAFGRSWRPLLGLASSMEAVAVTEPATLQKQAPDKAKLGTTDRRKHDRQAHDWR
jgi:hypothetical protein